MNANFSSLARLIVGAFTLAALSTMPFSTAAAQTSSRFASSKPQPRVAYWQERLAEIDNELRTRKDLSSVKLVFIGDSITDFWLMDENRWVKECFVAYRSLAPRRTPRIRGEYAIAELLPIPVNGVQQWLLIRGVDNRNPVLLFLHGGPGSAHIGVMRHYQKELEKYFVVVQWDQRGAGLSGNEPVPDETYNKEQFVSDGLEVTRYLRERFGQEKIFLVGHSWGSGLGYMMAIRRPEYFRAFAGLGQMSRDGEKLAYDETLRVARETNNLEAIRELELLGPPPYKMSPRSKAFCTRLSQATKATPGCKCATSGAPFWAH